MDSCWNCGTDRRGNPNPDFVHADSYRAPVYFKPVAKQLRFSIRSIMVLTAMIGTLMAIFRSEPLVLVILTVLATPLVIFWGMLGLYSVFYRLIHHYR